MRKATFKNVGGCRIDGKYLATVTIEHEEERAGLFTVRGKGKRHKYTMPLGAVAELVMWRMAKIAANEEVK